MNSAEIYHTCRAEEQASGYNRNCARCRAELCAPELLALLRKALTALNTAPRFAVPALDSDSYILAASIDATLKQVI